MPRRLAMSLGAIAFGLISLPIQTSAQCYIYFPSFISVNVPFETYWTSSCVSPFGLQVLEFPSDSILNSWNGPDFSHNFTLQDTSSGNVFLYWYDGADDGISSETYSVQATTPTSTPTSTPTATPTKGIKDWKKAALTEAESIAIYTVTSGVGTLILAGLGFLWKKHCDRKRNPNPTTPISNPPGKAESGPGEV